MDHQQQAQPQQQQQQHRQKQKQIKNMLHKQHKCFVVMWQCVGSQRHTFTKFKNRRTDRQTDGKQPSNDFPSLTLWAVVVVVAFEKFPSPFYRSLNYISVIQPKLSY